MRYFGFWFALALSFALMAGCSDENGEGGSGGTAGTGGMAGTGGTGGTGGFGECAGVEYGTECALEGIPGVCIWGNCYANDCSLVEDDTACAALGEFEWVPGLCSGGECLGECEVLEEGDACHRGPDSVGVCIDGIGCDERCENNDDCIDLKDCTSDTCLSNGLCESTPVQDGTPCAGGTCQSGACVLEGSVVPCSEQGIRNAIAAGSGSYTLDCDEPSPIVLTAEITIDDNDVILDGRGVTLDASNVEPPDETCFRVVEQVTVELSGFTLTGGSHAGVYNGANLTLANSTVTDNGVWGIDNDGVLTVINSTVSRNRGVLHRAQIENDGSLTLINSTVVGTAALSTGEFDEDRQYLTAIEGCIIRGSCTLQQALTSNGYNVESPGDTCGFDQGTDQVNVTTGQLNLQPLADNGGPTQTQALGEGSVAIDQIPADDCDVDIDQRGEPRPETGGTMCDVGAFEVQP